MHAPRLPNRRPPAASPAESDHSQCTVSFAHSLASFESKLPNQPSQRHGFSTPTRTITTGQQRHALRRTIQCAAAMLATHSAASESMGQQAAVVIPATWYQALNVAPDSRQQDLQAAHGQLSRQQPTKLGVSRKTLASRAAVLRQAAEEVLVADNRAIYDQLKEPLNYIEVRQSDVPGALCLLYESGAVQALSDVGLTYLRQQRGHPWAEHDSVTDVTVLTASALWNIAAALLQKQERQDILDAYDALTDGLQLLEQQPPLDKQLLGTFRGALEELAPSVALQLVGLPLDASHMEQRARGLELLKQFLSATPEAKMPGPGALAAYLQSVRKCLTADEEAAVLSLLKVDATSDAQELFELALFHVAQGCRNTRPEDIQTAAELLQQCIRKGALTSQDSSSLALDAQVGLSTCLQLLGQDEEALRVLGVAGQGGYTSPAPSLQQYFAECAAEGKDSTATLRLLANRWLEDIAFQTCRDAAPIEPFTVERWLKDKGVQVHLQGRSFVAGVMGAFNGSAPAATPTQQQRSANGANKIITGTFATVAALLGAVFVLRLPGVQSMFSRSASTTAPPTSSAAVVKVQAPARQTEPTAAVKKAAPVSTSKHVTEKQAHQIVSRWLEARAQALGPKPSSRALPNVLTGQMLESWQQRVAEVQSRNWHWNYSSRQIVIDSVSDLPDACVSVVASVDESASVVESGRVEEVYRYKYTADYRLVKVGGKWKIAAGSIQTR